jgi:hypothetical protein
MICIEDIAHALSKLPSIWRHLNRDYSVGQHSIECAKKAVLKDKLGALLHDASEAYLLICLHLLKDRLPDYKTCEHNLMLVIAEKFGFTYPLNDALKVIDSELLEIEWENLVITDNPNFNVMDRVETKDSL